MLTAAVGYSVPWIARTLDRRYSYYPHIWITAQIQITLWVIAKVDSICIHPSVFFNKSSISWSHKFPCICLSTSGSPSWLRCPQCFENNIMKKLFNTVTVAQSFFFVCYKSCCVWLHFHVCSRLYWWITRADLIHCSIFRLA